MEILAEGGAEIEECTTRLRWVRRPHTTTEPQTLQQAWRITVLDNKNKAMGSRIEWRDVTLEIE